MQTRNEVLWALKSAWISGASYQALEDRNGMVADWLEEQGFPEESRLLRGGEWVLIWHKPAQSFYVRPYQWKEIEHAIAWAVFWWPITSLDFAQWVHKRNEVLAQATICGRNMNRLLSGVNPSTFFSSQG